MSDTPEELDDDEAPEPVVVHKPNAKAEAFFSDSACEARWLRIKEALDRPKEPRALSAKDKDDADSEAAETILDPEVDPEVDPETPVL